MKKLTIILTILLASTIWSAAFAWPIVTPRNGHKGPTTHGVSYNPSFGQSIRILPQGFTVKYSRNECGGLVVTVQDTLLGLPIGEPRVTEFPCP